MSDSSVTWLGHSTTTIELDGVRILTDPVLRRRAAHLLRVGEPPAAPPAVDAVLISHGHLDHLDLPSLDRLGREVRVVCPHGLGSLVSARGFRSVTEVEPGDELEVGSVVVRATPAEHGGGKNLPGRGTATVGYALTGSASVFFAGDTDLFDAMDGLVPSLDVALLPIWGWGPTMGPGHLDPERAAEALTLLRPRIVVPIHWGTLRPFYRSSRAPFLREPLDAFVAAAARRAPEVDVRVLQPGETLVLGR